MQDVPREDLASVQIFQAIYEDLRRLATASMANEPAGQTLQPTALVHEVYLRLGNRRSPWRSRSEYFYVAAEAMRRILIERARRVRAEKRGGSRVRVTLEHPTLPLGPTDTQDVDLLDLNDALDELEQQDPRSAQVVKLRYLAGLSVEETAKALSVSVRTVRNDWNFSRAWLANRLTGDPKPQ